MLFIINLNITLKFIWLTICLLCGSREEMMLKIRKMKVSEFGTN